MHDYGFNKSDYYFVDPDGPLNGKEPIRVYCDFAEDYGFTRISHDSEEKIEVKELFEYECDYIASEDEDEAREYFTDEIIWQHFYFAPGA